MIKNHEHELDPTGSWCRDKDCRFEIMTMDEYNEHQYIVGSLRTQVVDHLIEEHGVDPRLLIPNRSEGHMASYHAVNHLHLAIHASTSRE